MKPTIVIFAGIACLSMISPAFVAFSQEAYNFELTWGSWGSGDGQFIGPGGVAASPSGDVYVADNGNLRIQRFDSDGIFIAKWSIPLGSYCLAGLGIDSSGNVYVTTQYCCILAPCPIGSMDRNPVLKFDSNGNLMANFGDWGTGDGQFDDPSGVAIDSSGNVYVVDTSNHRIQKFDSNGNMFTKWGSQGTGDGQFESPLGVAVDPLGNVYVADTGNNRIQKFDSNGNFITKWFTHSYDPIRGPEGVSADSLGDVYAINSGTITIPITPPPPQPSVMKFDSDGNLITKWGSWGSGDGQFNLLTFSNPNGIAVDSLGNVYIADFYNHRIQKFSPILIPQESISTPNTPSGPIDGIIGTDYTYSSGGSSSDLGHSVEYRYYWGDGTYSEWSASADGSKTWLSPGTYEVRAKARCALNTSIESVWSGPLTVTISPVPDLTGNWVFFTQMCRSTRIGPKCRITGKLSIQNVGTLNAHSSFVRFYLSTDNLYDEGTDSFLKQVATGTVRIGQSKTKMLSYSFQETASGKYIIAVIDAGNAVAESNESNNYIVFGPIH